MLKIKLESKIYYAYSFCNKFMTVYDLIKDKGHRLVFSFNPLIGIVDMLKEIQNTSTNNLYWFI